MVAGAASEVKVGGFDRGRKQQEGVTVGGEVEVEAGQVTKVSILLLLTDLTTNGTCRKILMVTD